MRKQSILMEEAQVLEKNPDKEKIGLLGGTFNPPHVGHLIIADQVRNQLGLEEVWFIPTAEPPHKDGKETIDPEHRLNMLVRAIQGNSYFDLNTIEVDHGGKNYTIDTVTELQKKHPDKEFYFIIGADMVEDLPNWHEIDKLVEIIQIVGVNRLNYKRETDYPMIWVDVPNVDISSTDLREAVRLGHSIRYQVPNAVIDYIFTHELYLEEEDEGGL